VDFENACIAFPDSKTRAKTVPVGAVVLDLLRSLERVEGNEYVFVGDNPGKPAAQFVYAWSAILKRAKLKDLKIHDLRHTFATSASADGMELKRIQKLLVHSQETMTRRYVHVLPKPSRADREAADQVSRRLYERLSATG
jgi:integrase